MEHRDPATTRPCRSVALGVAITLALGLSVVAPTTATAGDRGRSGDALPDHLPPDTTVTNDGRTMRPSGKAPPRGGSPGYRGSAPQPMRTQTIVGAEDWYHQTLHDAYPWRASGLITVDDTQCTGWLIDEDTVITAGHCVHEGPGGDWRAVGVFYPGRDGNEIPYGWCGEVRLYTTLGWARDGPRT